MKLLTEELKKKFEEYPLYSQEGKSGDAKVIAKFFNPMGQGTWLITEGDVIRDEQGNIEDVEMFGFVNLMGMEYAELGYVSLNELQSIKLPFGLTIERDLYYPKDITLRDACQQEFGEVPDILISEYDLKYSVYQLNDKESNHFLRFEPINRLKNGIEDIKFSNYDKVYENSREYSADNIFSDEILEELFEEFNINIPKDYKGHSLSVSDVIVLECDGVSKAYYCDTFGFKEIPSFIEQLTEQKMFNLAKRVMSVELPKDIDVTEINVSQIIKIKEQLNTISGCEQILTYLTSYIEKEKNDMTEARYEGNFSKESEYEGEELIAEHQSLCDDITAHINELKEKEQIKDEPDICE